VENWEGMCFLWTEGDSYFNTLYYSGLVGRRRGHVRKFDAPDFQYLQKSAGHNALDAETQT